MMGCDGCPGRKGGGGVQHKVDAAYLLSCIGHMGVALR